MDVLYLSSVCSQHMFDEMSDKGLITKLPQAQKYHTLMLEGIRSNIDGEVEVLSSYPVEGEKIHKQHSEVVNGIKYIYLGFLQFPFIRQLCLNLKARSEIAAFLKNHPDALVICDVLNHSISSAALSVCHKKGKKVCGIVTDVPGHTSGARMKTYSLPKKAFIKFCSLISKGQEEKFDTYLLLTEAMNEVVNHGAKPYIVIEGQADIKMKLVENDPSKKETPNVMIYAGGIHKEFGIERFVKAFINLNKPNWILRIYGDGNYSEELKKLSAQNEVIQYCGVRPNSEVVKKQLGARVLVNPRLTDAEYVKYSFPSKTMECMASGTPLLTTVLPGMPKEYYSYVYLIRDESLSGMESALSEIMNNSNFELQKKGAEAQSFILNTRNNQIQAEKLISFLKDC